jgi:hypothetical protein
VAEAAVAYKLVAAWALAVVGPALLTLAALPLRSLLVPGGFLPR